MRFAILAGIAFTSFVSLSLRPISSAFQSPRGAQNPPAQPAPADKPTPTRSKGDKAFIQNLEDQMQGAWRLTAMESPFLEKENRQQVGFLVLSGNHFSFEMHIGWTVPTGVRLDRRDFISGTHRFELDERAHMTTSTVIGSFFDQRGNLIFEQPGTRREYEVQVTHNQLVLKNVDGRQFTFERMLDSHTHTDIFGRPLKEKPEDAGKAEAGAPKKEPPKQD